MQYLALALRAGIVIIWIMMMYQNASMTPPFLSGLAFILIAWALCLNRIMAVKWTPCLMKCFNKTK